IPAVQPGQRQHHEHVGTMKLGIPCRFTANPCTTTQISLDQRWNGRLAIATRRCDRKCQMRLDAIFNRRHVVFCQCMLDSCSIDTTIRQPDAGAASQVFTAMLLDESSDTCPQHHDDGATAVFRMYASTSCFSDTATQMIQASQIKF